MNPIASLFLSEGRCLVLTPQEEEDADACF